MIDIERANTESHCRSSWLTAVLVLDGFASVVAPLVYLPLGVAVVGTNAALAVGFRGGARALVLAFALLGAATCIAAAFFLLPGPAAPVDPSGYGQVLG